MQQSHTDTFNLIAMPSEDLTGPEFEGLSQEMRDNFIRDKKFARLTLKNGRPSADVSANEAESACDAYAMMLHMQRHKDSEFPEQYRSAQAAHIIFGPELSHFTSPVINRVMEEIQGMGETAFLSLSKEAIAAMAEEAAQELGLDDATLQKMNEKYAEITYPDDNDQPQDDGVLAVIRRIIDVVDKEKNNKDAADAGKWYLMHPLRKMSMMKAAAAEKIGDFWARAIGIVTGEPPSSLSFYRAPLASGEPEDMQQSLAQTLNEVAKEAAEAFPNELGRLAVVIPGADKPIAFISPAAAKDMAKNPAAINEAVDGVAQRLDRTGAVSYTRGSYDLAGAYINLIALANPKEIVGNFSDRHTKEMQTVFTLDHQIGLHAVKSGASLSANKLQSAAEAYAMLRHIQRYGTNTDLAAIRTNDAAANLVLFANTAHYTADTLQQVTEMANSMGKEFFKLPPRRLAEMAAQIADDNHPDLRTLRKLKSAFKPVASRIDGDVFDKLANKDPQTCAMLCRETLAVMQKNAGNAAIIKAGKRFLSTPALKEFITAKAATGDKASQQALALINKPDPQSPNKRRFSSFIPRH